MAKNEKDVKKGAEGATAVVEEAVKQSDNTAKEIFAGLVGKLTPEDIKEILEQHGMMPEPEPVVKTYNRVAVKGYASSVEKHVNAILVSVHKLQDSEYVPESIWRGVEKQIARVQTDNYKENALATEYVKREGRGGRKPADAAVEAAEEALEADKQAAAAEEAAKTEKAA